MSLHRRHPSIGTRSRHTCGLAAVFLLTISAGVADAATVRVPLDYPTIQAAVNAALVGSLPDGSVIELQPGTYRQPVTIANTARSLTLRTVPGSGSAVIDASGTGLQTLRIMSATGTIRIESIVISGGFSTGWGGGLVVTNASPSFLNVIVQNNAALDGAGVLLSNSDATFDGCTIQNNLAQRFGGGLLIVAGSRPVFTNSFIRNNRAGVSTNHAIGGIGSGGGLHVNDASPTFRHSTIGGNQSKFAGGGIIQIGLYGSANGPATLTLEDSDLSNNVSTRHASVDNPPEGGGINLEDNAIAYISRSRVANNVAGTGGGLNAFRARFVVTSSILEGNKALDSQNVGGFGGGISATSNNTTSPVRPAAVISLTDTVVRANAARIGGAIFAAGDYYCGSSINDPNAPLSAYRPIPAGPCPAKTAVHAILTIQDSLLDSNTAATQGGAVRIDRTNATITRSHVLRNTVTLGTMQAYAGGLLAAQASQLTVSGSTFAGNSAAGYGGGLFIDDDAAVDVNGSNIYKNSATNGGGLYVGSLGSVTGTVQSSVIADNANYQIYEQACKVAAPILAFRNNTITNLGSLLIYRTLCTPPSPISSISTFNGLPSGRASGNNSNTPTFSSFLATPKVGMTVLSWVVARASAVSITGIGSFTGSIATVDVAPQSPTTYVMTASGSATTLSASTSGGPLSPPKPVQLGVRNDGPVVGDYDGDGKADEAVFNSISAVWTIRRSSTGTQTTIQLGAPSLGDVPVPADYDGDGKMDIGVYRRSTGVWYVQHSSNGSLVTFAWGAPRLSVPVPADYDGDGKADFAVFHKVTAQWLIYRSSDGGTTKFRWGAPARGDTPVVADYDGDSKADIALFRTSTAQWFILRSTDGGLTTLTWGASHLGDKPVPADYDGDGKDDIAVYRKSSGDWFILLSSGGVTVTAWGSPATRDVPVPASYTGDAAVDLCVWSPIDGSWRR